MHLKYSFGAAQTKSKRRIESQIALWQVLLGTIPKAGKIFPQLLVRMLQNIITLSIFVSNK